MLMPFVDDVVSGDSLLKVKSYTGQLTDQAISTNQDFATREGMIWLKAGSVTGNNLVYDTERGDTASFIVNSNAAEDALSDDLVSFDSSGFTLTGDEETNADGVDSVGLCWLAESDYFDVFLYTGTGANNTSLTTGISDDVKFIIFKKRNDVGNWVVYHASLGITTFLRLNSNIAAFVDGTIFSGTFPGPHNDGTGVVVVGNNSDVNENLSTYVAYLFAEKASNSKFGLYVGSGAAGNAITGLGFSPSVVLVKRTDSTGDWFLAYYDGTDFNSFYANLTDAAIAASTNIQFDANGFTLQSSLAAINASGGTYVYAAWK